MAGRIEGKVAVITGGASGIGLGIARRFVGEGAHVVLGDVDAAGLAAAAAELGDACRTVTGSVTSEADVEALFATALDQLGGVDVVVANAGAGGFAPLVDHPLGEWQRVIDLCLTGVFLTVKHAGRNLGPGGSIVTIASLNAVQPAEGMAAYCAAKAGVAMLTKVAAMELGRRGIRATCIAPGLVQTNATAPMFAVPGLVDEFVENTTIGRFAEPADVAALALFLASDEAAFVTGSFHLVDGGASTRRYPDLTGAITRATTPSP
jgi:NAD(P)-dependent dehydrogenase (short-subunit alcohol dehydrogenase family)